MGLFDWLKGKPWAGAKAEVKGEEIGRVTHYFPHVHVAVIDLKKGSLQKGDQVRIHGHTTDFTQKITSMQVEHQAVEEAPAGSSVGIKVSERVRAHDQVLKVVE